MTPQEIQISFSGLQVSIVEDRVFSMRGLQERLESMGCEIIWTARDEEEARQKAKKQFPKVAFIDLGLHPRTKPNNHQDGWELIKDLIKQKQGRKFTPIVYTGTPIPDSIVLEAIRMGCSFIVKEDLWDNDIEVLASALLAALSNSVMLSHEVASELETIVSQSEVSNILSDRELEILALLVKNLSNKQIAQKLFIEVSTVKSHVSNVLSKLNVSSRGQAAEWYRQRYLA